MIFKVPFTAIIKMQDQYNQQFLTHCNDVQAYLDRHTIERTLEHFDRQTYLEDDISIFTEGFFGNDQSDEISHICIGLWFEDPVNFNKKKLREVLLYKNCKTFLYNVKK